MLGLREQYQIAVFIFKRIVLYNLFPVHRYKYALVNGIRCNKTLITIIKEV
jgi:hypothetical protein